jgi:predicted GIY-YIG superfamily endonuclease
MLYVLRFSEPLGDRSNPRGQARYYLGFCEDGRLEARLAEHRAGQGARITAAAVERHIWFDVVLTLPGTRADERHLKTSHKNWRKLVERELRARDNAKAAAAARAQTTTA